MLRNLTFAFVVLLSIAQLAFGQDAEVQDDPARPNVIFVLADDLGYGDLSCYGQTKFSTPNIDALAAKGMRFTEHYSGSSVCAPSRCCLMTGYHTGHCVVRGNAEVKPEGQEPMPADTFTVAQLFKEGGYRTGLFGKWGLGAPYSTSEPLKMGFDRFYGYNCQRIAHCYYPSFLWNDDERELLIRNATNHRTTYAPELIQEQAINFIRENKEQPFFMYYAAVQPHADMIAPKNDMKKFIGKFGKEKPYRGGGYIAQENPRAAYAAMVTILDDYVGEISNELETLGIADNTLIIFSSDNGPHVEGGNDPAFFDSNGLFKGTKRDLYDGGIHVPFIASWPAKIAAGSESNLVSAFWDFLPTVSELIDQPLPKKVDGVSMLPTLLGKPGQKQHDYLYWEFSEKGGRVAIRKGNWKGVRYKATNNPDSPIELYDLVDDPEESINVAQSYPEIASDLRDLIESARTVPANPRFDYLKKKKKNGKK